MQEVNVLTNKIIEKLKTFPPVTYMLILLLISFSVISREQYLSFSNFRNVLIQATPLMIIAFAQTLIVLTQGTDLSLGAQVNMSSVLMVFLALRSIPMPIAILLGIISCIIVGIVNGIVVAKGNIPPFIATYGMQNICNSIALLLAAGSSLYISSPIYELVTKINIIRLPILFWVAVAMFIMVWIVLNKTRFGTNIRGLGGNREALSLAGIDYKLNLIKVYAFAGFIAGIAGFITLCRIESGQTTVANGWEFQAVAATLLGGSSMREGKGNVTGTIFGVLLIQIVKNGLNVSGVKSIYQNAIIGSIVLIAIIFDALVRNKKKEV
jgi:ribose transport system permease protein